MADKKTGRDWICKNCKGQIKQIVLLSILCIFSSAIGVSLALLLKELVDAAVSGQRDEFFMLAVFLTDMIFLQILIGYALRYLDERSRADLENELKQKVWKTILTRNYASLEHYYTGELMNRLTSDVRVVSDHIVALVPNCLSMLTRLVCALVILVLLDWRFTLVFMTGGILVMGFSYFFREKMKKMHKNMQKAEGKLRSFLQEMMESILVVRSFQLEERVEGIAWEYMKEHKRTRLQKNKFSNFSQTGFSVIMNVGYLFGICWCGAGILNHTITYGTLLAVQQLIGQIQQPIANIAGIIPKYFAMTASAERLMELEILSEDAREGENKVSQDIYDISQIRIENLSTGYEREHLILEGANLQINKGDIMAVTGESGVGKSTLLKMLLCIYPFSEGSVEVCDSFGNFVPLHKGMRGLFAYVPQGNFLMSGTIREVVSLYGMSGSMTVEQVCHIACADFVEKLEKRYDTELGERGIGLSEGQTQRLAIARALYTNAPVLLLDESTSALDSETEAQVLKNIRQLKDKTVVIVTHRPAALSICNRVVEIRDKRIKEKC